jgi:hypothetical protein
VLADTGAIEEENVLDYVTALASTAGHATILSSFYSAVEEQIERSKPHWSMLVDQSGCMDGEGEAEVSNVEVFKALQRHPTWGGFFSTFCGGLDHLYDYGHSRLVMGEKFHHAHSQLVMGEKFAEGGQAELYNAHVKWWNPEANEEDVREGIEYVLKVFKKGTFLRDLQLQLPRGLLQFIAEDIENMTSPTPKVLPRYSFKVYFGTLLVDGRFAFLCARSISICAI